MKKFKLIKEYPNSPKLGTIVIHHKSTRDINYWGYFQQEKPISIVKGIDVDPHDYPEFWEEVIEKDYEILSFINSYNDICKKLPNGNFSFSNNTEVKGLSDDFLINSPCKIHSVKRLSDGEVFTVGDKIKSYNTIKTIKEINLPKNTPNDIGFITTSPNWNVTGYQYLIGDNVKKVKDPLFTTEDGVDIYEGDKYFILGGSQGLWEYNTKINEDIAKVGTGQLHESKCIIGSKIYWIKFSTREAAEEYILMNKPCLSINDIIKHTNFSFHTVIEELKTKVKSKLK